MYYIQLFVIVIYKVHLSKKSILLLVYLFFHLSVYPSACLSVSIHASTYLSFYLSVVLLFYCVICLTIFLVVSSAESQFWWIVLNGRKDSPFYASCVLMQGQGCWNLAFLCIFIGKSIYLRSLCVSSQLSEENKECCITVMLLLSPEHQSLLRGKTLESFTRK